MINSILGKPISSEGSVSALRNNLGGWALNSQDKADLFAHHFEQKWSERTFVHDHPSIPDNESFIPFIRSNMLLRILKKLRLESSSGPDLISALILFKLRLHIVKPLCYLLCSILRHGTWPDLCARALDRPDFEEKESWSVQELSWYPADLASFKSH